VTTLTSAQLQLPPLLVADGGALVRELEAWLAAQPVPVAKIPVPVISRYGSTTIAWDHDMPAPVRRPVDWLLRRPVRPVEIDTATHLRLMSRLLVQHGWCQGLMYDAQGRHCLLGASLAVLAAGYGTQREANRAVTRLMEGALGEMPGIRSVAEWNDKPGRTAAQVHRALDVAAARAQRYGC
jgi:hypothetical protein